MSIEKEYRDLAGIVDTAKKRMEEIKPELFKKYKEDGKYENAVNIYSSKRCTKDEKGYARSLLSKTLDFLENIDGTDALMREIMLFEVPTDFIKESSSRGIRVIKEKSEEK